MYTYQFYIEYDGRKTVSHAYDMPIETIVTDSIDHAARQFAEKSHLKKIKLDQLDEKDYRVFLKKKNLFGNDRELIYFVRII